MSAMNIPQPHTHPNPSPRTQCTHQGPTAVGLVLPSRRSQRKWQMSEDRSLFKGQCARVMHVECKGPGRFEPFQSSTDLRFALKVKHGPAPPVWYAVSHVSSHLNRSIARLLLPQSGAALHALVPYVGMLVEWFQPATGIDADRGRNLRVRISSGPGGAVRCRRKHALELSRHRNPQCAALRSCGPAILRVPWRGETITNRTFGERS